MTTKQKDKANNTKEKTTTQKKSINKDTVIRLYNNTTGSISFQNRNGDWVRIMEKGFQDVTFSDVELLLNTCPKMLENGVIYIAFKEVREKLGLQYDNIFALKDIKQLLSLPLSEMIEKLSKSSRDLQVEVALHLIANIGEYPYNVINAVSKLTGISIVEYSE